MPIRAALVPLVLAPLLIATAAGAQLESPSPVPSASASPSATSSPLPAAGTIPPAVSVGVTAESNGDFIRRRVREEVMLHAALCRGCTADVNAATFDPAAMPADGVDVAVRLSGPNVTDVTGTTRLRVRTAPASSDPALTLLYSDDPETIRTDGVVFRAQTPLALHRAARLYAYHVSAADGRTLYLVLTATQPSHVQLLGDMVGPDGDYVCAGHTASAAFLSREPRGIGLDLAPVPGAPVVLPLNAFPMAAQTLDIAFYDAIVTSGGPVGIAVVAASNGANPLTLASGPELPGDGHNRRGEYDLRGIAPRTLLFTAGSGEEPSATLGASDANAPLPALRADRVALRGEYGVVRPLHLDMTNPTAAPSTVTMYFDPASGAATGTLAFGDLPRPVEIPRSSTRVAVRRFTINAGQRILVDAAFTPDGASGYPVEIGLTEAAVPDPVGDPGPCARQVDPLLR